MSGNLHENGSSWMRKYDCESQKEYFIANTPPTECYDFEVPQRIAESPKPTTLKLFNDLDKIFFDDHNSRDKVRDQMSNISSESCGDPFNFWSNESSCRKKVSKKSFKAKEKSKSENSKLENSLIKISPRITQDGEELLNILSSFSI